MAAAGNARLDRRLDRTRFADCGLRDSPFGIADAWR